MNAWSGSLALLGCINVCADCEAGRRHRDAVVTWMCVHAHAGEECPYSRPQLKARVSFVSENTLHGGPLAKFGEAFFAKYMDHGTEMAMETAKAHIEAGIPAEAAGASR